MATSFKGFHHLQLGGNRLLTIARILAWADAFHATNGRWPIAARVPVFEAPGETWDGIDRALRRRERGLSGGFSLARLLAERRGAGKPMESAPLRIEKILVWADAYHAAHGRWPIAAPVPVAEAPEESWDRIDQALRRGERGLSGGSSLVGLLAERRGTREPRALPPLDQILAWADAYHAAHGRWPIAAPVPVAGAPEESWDRIDHALRRGGAGALHGILAGSPAGQAPGCRQADRAPPAPHPADPGLGRRLSRRQRALADRGSRPRGRGPRRVVGPDRPGPTPRRARAGRRLLAHPPAVRARITRKPSRPASPHID